MAKLRKRLPGMIVLVLSCALGLLTGHACGSGTSGDDVVDGGNNPIPDSGQGGLCARCSITQKCCMVGAGQACVESRTDRNNCGDCGHVCSPTTSDSCASGMCVCALTAECTAGKTCCATGSSPGCADLQTDNKHCGDCMTTCGTNQVCSGSHCLCGGGDAGVGRACTTGESCCPQGCTNTMDDSLNCGGCGIVCPTVQGHQLSCFGGQCRCGAGGAVCPTGVGPTGKPPVLECCGNDCVDVCGAAMNCGGCGISCTGGIINMCLGGMCFGGTAGEPDGGIPSGCSILPTP